MSTDPSPQDRRALIQAIVQYRMTRNGVVFLFAAVTLLVLIGIPFPALRLGLDWSGSTYVLGFIDVVLLIYLVHVLRRNAIGLGASNPDTWPRGHE